MTPRMLVTILSRLHGLRQRDGWERTRLLAYKARALEATRAYAYARSPFYQRFHRALQAAPLTTLPVLTKADLMEHFDEIVTDRAVHLVDVEAHLAGPAAGTRFRGRYWVAATSGSSGRRGIFLFDNEEWAAIIASFVRAREWAGLRLDLTR